MFLHAGMELTAQVGTGAPGEMNVMYHVPPSLRKSGSFSCTRVPWRDSVGVVVVMKVQGRK